MNKAIYIIAAVAILGIMAVYYETNINKKTVSVPTYTSAQTSQASTTSTDNSASQAVQNNESTNLKDGTFGGSVESNQFGNVEISLIISGGKITDVKLIQMPDSDPRSSQISSYAGQQLVAETISKQSSNIDTISGATYTSMSYINSIQSALDKAKV